MCAEERTKCLRDPVYGYVRIPENYTERVIDTAPFQRLRRVIQTSYSPLYPSAVHNRFVHSIGVYYLGNLVSDQLTKEIQKQDIKTDLALAEYGNVFKLACLLHDVGHAPFSHTGEEFFLEENNPSNLHQILLTLLGNPDRFAKEIPKDSSLAAAPHEIMSAIVGIKEYGELLGELEPLEGKEFFARCITGYQYDGGDVESDIKNCFISMLNSKIIDVDKLDYLLRDAYATGFDTVSIDYVRLLRSLTIAKVKDHYQIAYYKTAISVIENVVYAHDSERKWIQNHPICLYESYLLKHIMALLCHNLNGDGEKFFSRETLSEKGQQFQVNNEIICVSLLCDDDIIFLMKNRNFNGLSALCKEFFERRTRRHPVWKSEAEYKAYMDIATGGKLLENFEKAMEETAIYLNKNTDSWVIDDELIEKLEREIEDIEDRKLDDESKKSQRENKDIILKVMHSLQSYAREKHMECSFVLVKVSQFSSGFGKPDFFNTNIVFRTSTGDKVDTVGKIVSSIQAREREQKRDTFFYLFYTREQNVEQINNEELCTKLFKNVVF